MELKNMSIEELEARKLAIAEEVDKDGADLDALTEEVRSINTELETRKADETKKVEIRQAVAQGAGTVIESAPEQMEERKEMAKDNIEVRNSSEYINAFANYIKTGKDAECRSLLTENVSGGVPVPELVDEIVRTAWDRNEITRLVRKTYIKGNLKVGFEVSATGADVHTEGTNAPSEETLVLGITELVPESIKKWITVSDEALDLSGEAFLRYVYDEVTYQIAKKAADQLIADIEACGTVSTNSGSSHLCAVPEVTENSIALASVANAIAQLSDEASAPVIVMNKTTYAAFKAVQYSGNYGADPFEGLPVYFNSTIKAYSAATSGETYAIVGDFGVGAQFNFPNGEEVKFTFDNLSLAEKDLVKIVGREFVAHDVVAPKAFVKIVK